MTRRQWLATTPAPLLAVPAPESAPPAKRLLTASLTPASIEAALIPAASWRAYPAATPPQAIPDDARSAAISAAEAQLGQPWPSLPATLFLEYRRNGNRSRYEAVNGARRRRVRELAVAEYLEGKGRFLDELANGIWLVCEETFWGYPAHLNAQKAGSGLPDAEEPVVDLFAAETASLLGWTHHLLAPALARVSPLLPRRIEYETRRRILDPCFARDDFGWMGLSPKLTRAVNNWNPWICSNWLTSALLFEPAERRPRVVHKILTCLDRFLDGYAPDGGCDEGPSYWGRAGASLFECLDLLHRASAGKLDYFNLPLVQEIGRYIYRVHIDRDWYVNFADASARIRAGGDLIYRYGRRIGDRTLMAHGAYAASLEGMPNPDSGSLARQLDSLFNLTELRRAAAGNARPAFPLDAWMPGIGVLTARHQQGSPNGFFLAAQGGHNAESHNHNDVGNFLVFHNGAPILVDAGVETYTAKTFSSSRYDIWTMQSAYHNLPTINGVMQSAGRQFEARNVRATRTPALAQLELDIAAAWPPMAAVTTFQRSITLHRDTPRVALADRWQLAAARSLEWNFITPLQPRAATPGKVALGALILTYPETYKFEVDEIPITDARLTPIWGSSLRRFRLIAPTPPAEGKAEFVLTA
ncbi:MAG TPA: heparinase II/III family protein [Bryobacteraceae bacterium]|nr:heparinase II/III family protein [Bryobacteraceae bacterium]